MLFDASSIPPTGGSDKPHKPEPLQNPKSDPLQNPKSVPEQSISDIAGHRYLGMNFTKRQWAKFLANMMNMMMTQMKRDNEHMLKAIRKLKED